MNRPILNLPEIAPRIEEREGVEFIFDSVRKKYLMLTPEEWVRQHFLGLLINQLNYPAGLIQVERQHHYHQNKKRSDIIVLDKEGRPFLLVECKAPEIPIQPKVLAQVAMYNKSVQASYIAVSNGLKHFVWKRSEDSYQQLKAFPIYAD